MASGEPVTGLGRRRLGGVLLAASFLAAACVPQLLRRPRSTVGDPQVLVVATEPAFAPFTYRDGERRLTGFDIELMNQLVQHLNLSVEYVEVPFDGLFSMLESGGADAAISAITITPERQRTVTFSRPYFQTKLVIVVRAEDADVITAPADLRGRVVGAKLGTTGASAARDIAGTEVMLFDNTELALATLADGGVDAVINDAPATIAIVTQNQLSGITLTGPLLDAVEPYGIAVADQRNLQAINQALEAMEADGRYEQLYRKWFGQAPPPLPPPVPTPESPGETPVLGD